MATQGTWQKWSMSSLFGESNKVNCSTVESSCCSKIWLYAGITRESDSSRLSRLTICSVESISRKGPASAGNPQRLYAKLHFGEDIVRTLWRHKELTEACKPHLGNKMLSERLNLREGPCRVSSGPHERRNELTAVLTYYSAKLQWP